MSNTPRIQTKDFYMLTTPTLPTVLTPDLPAYNHFGCGCDFTLKVLADDSGLTLRNDVSGFLWWFNDTINDAELTLQKWVSGAWSNVYTMTGNTLGTNYPFEFFTNDAGEIFIGYQLEWALVLDVHGEGNYRVKCDTTDYLSQNNTLYSYEYCLKTYTDYRANGTVRIEFYNNNTLGISDNDKAVKDFGNLNWYNSFRLPGWFGYPKSTYEKTNIQYNTGQILDVVSEQTPEYELQLKLVPFFVHEALRIDMMQGDSVLITDYNNRNVINYVSKQVKASSSYEPQYHKGINKLSSVNVKFIQEFNNLKKLHY